MFVGIAPWVLYGVGLRNIEGRPVPPVFASLGVEEEIAVARMVRSRSSRISVEPISPWSYLLGIASADPDALGSGTFAASLVARRYNLTHLETRTTMGWHLSGAALTIWLTRYWTADQVVAAVAQIALEDAAKETGASRAH